MPYILLQPQMPGVSETTIWTAGHGTFLSEFRFFLPPPPIINGRPLSFTKIYGLTSPIYLVLKPFWLINYTDNQPKLSTLEISTHTLEKESSDSSRGPMGIPEAVYFQCLGHRDKLSINSHYYNITYSSR